MQIQTSVEREHARLATVQAAVRKDPVLRRTAVAGAAWCVAFAVASILAAPGSRTDLILGDVVYLVPVVAAAVLTVAAALRASTRHRAFWIVLAASTVLWLVGELAWGFIEIVLKQEPFPSVADVFYLGGMALMIPAVVLGFARRRRLRAWRAALDASILVVAVGYLGWTVLVAPQLTAGITLPAAVGAAYPLLSVATLMVLISLAFCGHVRVPRAVVLVGAAVLSGALANVAYTHLIVLESYVSGSVINVGWQLEAILLCLAALVTLRHDEGVPDEQAQPRDVGLALVLAGLAVCLALVGADVAGGDVSHGAFLLLCFAVVAVVLRLILTTRESARYARQLGLSLREQERLAVTDALTGLHNRRFFEEMLKLEVERTQRGSEGAGLLVLDLDHFKTVNDRYGHPAGDTVLRETARRLIAALRSIDVIARYGGEEFVVVLPDVGVDALEMIAERCREAIGGQPFVLDGGETITVTASIGAACHPVHSADSDDLMRVADASLYAAKDLGRDVVQIGRPAVRGTLPKVSTMTAFFENLAEEIDETLVGWPRSRAVSRWAAETAGLLGLDAGETARCAEAGRFHDIGMLRVPQATLTKPGPLGDEEWASVQRHPEHGERMLGLSKELKDVARVVAQHHERWDGSGYPARLAGNEIAIEARVVAVCEAWAAMVSDRPYRPALDRDAARAELLDGAGRQFDSYVVAAFLELEASGRLESREAVTHRS